MEKTRVTTQNKAFLIGNGEYRLSSISESAFQSRAVFSLVQPGRLPGKEKSEEERRILILAELVLGWRGKQRSFLTASSFSLRHLSL